jgi:DNA-binding transcriptional regulator/RsmH inhibitor MraZ
LIPPPANTQPPALGRAVGGAGARDHVEIWDRAAWREQLKDVEGSVELVAERLAAKQD